MKIKGSCAIITGGANGFGKSLAECLVADGANVVIGDIVVEKGVALEHELNKNGKRAVFCKCDVTVESDLLYLFQTANNYFGGAQIVVNNAGIAPIENLRETTNTVDSIVDINLKAVIKGTSLAIQHFLKQKENPSNLKSDFSVINISSASALLPLTNSPVYSATKKGVLYFSQTLRYLKKFNIRVNCILPSFADTNLTKKYTEAPGSNKIVEKLGGFVSVADVVKSIQQLITDENMAGDAFLITPEKKITLPRYSKSNL